MWWHVVVVVDCLPLLQLATLLYKNYGAFVKIFELNNVLGLKTRSFYNIRCTECLPCRARVAEPALMISIQRGRCSGNVRFEVISAIVWPDSLVQ